MATFPHTPMPQQGLPRDEVMQKLITMKQDDQDWRGGRVFSLVYSAGDDIHELLSDALSLYSAENGLNVLAFPSIGVMQHDIVSNTASLLGADDPASGGAVEGYLTSGGTESLLQAVKTARDVGRDRGLARPRVVAAESAHAAFTKAADYFDVDLVRVPVDADFRVSASRLADACTDETIMVVGSAPTYPQGVIDPIADIAALALERGILCHVDACMGGFLLPFLTELGRLDEPFDFRVPGVTSMSADVHKYGYASKGVSVILYRTHELARMQLFVTTDWLGGFYASTAMAGTRPAGPVAAAWAALMHIGHEGYLELTRTAHDAARELRAGVESIEGLAVRGDPPATVLAFGAKDADALDIFAVGERLAAEGWYLDRQNRPDSLHATVHAGSAATVPALVNDLRHAVREVGTRPRRVPRHDLRADLGGLHGELVDVAPDPVFVWLERLDQRVARGVEVLGGVLVRRRVAAVDLPAGQAEAQVQPRAADLHTFAAPRGCLRIDVADLVQMRALGHGLSCRRYEVVMPPSTGRAAPVTPEELAPHNQAISAAGSSGCRSRCTSCWAPNSSGEDRP